MGADGAEAQKEFIMLGLLTLISAFLFVATLIMSFEVAMLQKAARQNELLDRIEGN